MKIKRQGDVTILPLNKKPDGFKKLPHLTVAVGETTGHSHQITDGVAELYQNENGQMYLSVLSEIATLSHEEHEEQVLVRGNYEIVIQKEWDWFSKIPRKVVD